MNIKPLIIGLILFLGLLATNVEAGFWNPSSFGLQASYHGYGYSAYGYGYRFYTNPSYLDRTLDYAAQTNLMNYALATQYNLYGLARQQNYNLYTPFSYS